MQIGKNGAGPVAAAVVLAGGRSRRMGSDKAALPWADTSLLHHALAGVREVFDSVYLSVAEPGSVSAPAGVELIVDAVSGGGPLAGVAASLDRVPTEWVFVLACDMPFADAALWHALAERAGPEVDVVVPRTARGREPLCAFYSRRCLGPFQKQLESDDPSMHAALGNVRVAEVDARTWERPDANPFTNVNTPEDYAAARACAAAEAARGDA